jgi:hypothetical protein
MLWCSSDAIADYFGIAKNDNFIVNSLQNFIVNKKLYLQNLVTDIGIKEVCAHYNWNYILFTSDKHAKAITGCIKSNRDSLLVMNLIDDHYTCSIPPNFADYEDEVNSGLPDGLN